MKLRLEFLADTKNPNHIHIITSPGSVNKLEEMILKKVPKLFQPMIAGRLRNLHDNNNYNLPKRAILDWGEYKIEIEVAMPTGKATGGGKI